MGTPPFPGREYQAPKPFCGDMGDESDQVWVLDCCACVTLLFNDEIIT